MVTAGASPRYSCSGSSVWPLQVCGDVVEVGVLLLKKSAGQNLDALKKELKGILPTQLWFV